jgi:hypothetical protein
LQKVLMELGLLAAALLALSGTIAAPAVAAQQRQASEAVPIFMHGECLLAFLLPV